MTRLAFIPMIVSCLVLGAASCNRTDDAIARPEAASAAKHVESIESKPSPKPFKSFPDEWFFYGQNRSPALRDIEGKPAAEFNVKDWIGQPQKMSDLKGKIVIVDFWGVWCPPCRASIPHNVELADKYKDQGVVVIGIHTVNQAAGMPAFAKNANINYSLSVDENDKTGKAYHVSFWPTYVLIDRNGIIRAAGLQPGSVEMALEAVLKEAS